MSSWLRRLETWSLREALGRFASDWDHWSASEKVFHPFRTTTIQVLCPLELVGVIRQG